MADWKRFRDGIRGAGLVLALTFGGLLVASLLGMLTPWLGSLNEIIWVPVGLTPLIYVGHRVGVFTLSRWDWLVFYVPASLFCLAFDRWPDRHDIIFPTFYVIIFFARWLRAWLLRSSTPPNDHGESDSFLTRGVG